MLNKSSTPISNLLLLYPNDIKIQYTSINNAYKNMHLLRGYFIGIDETAAQERAKVLRSDET